MSPPVRQQVTGYMVTCLPDEHPEQDVLTIRVERTGHERWAIRWSGRVLNIRTKEWEYEPLNSSRTDEWKAVHRTTLESALALARKMAPELTVNGFTVEKFMEWHRNGGS